MIGYVRVITSYSIHYTKLYDYIGKALMIQAPFHAIGIGMASVTVEKLARIPSPISISHFPRYFSINDF